MRCGVSVSVDEHDPICFIANREPIRFLTAQKASVRLSHLPSGKATETSPSLNLGVPTKPLYGPFPSNLPPPVGIPPEGLKTYPARDGCRAEAELCRSKKVLVGLGFVGESEELVLSPDKHSADPAGAGHPAACRCIPPFLPNREPVKAE